jgi:hypothetical protein
MRPLSPSTQHPSYDQPAGMPVIKGVEIETEDVDVELVVGIVVEDEVLIL